MKMDFSVAWGRELATYEIAEHSIAAEEAGFDMLGIIDTQNLARDPYPAMTIAALNTNRVRIGPSVTNTFTRHPSVTANAMATIDEISGGRAWVGLGSGFSAARTMDVGVQPMTLLENVINFIHTYTSGQEAEFNGAKMHNEWISRRLPVYVHAAGPKTCDIGGRLGDGLLLASKGSPIVARWCLDLVRRAAESAGRDPDDLDIRVCLPIFVEEEGWQGLGRNGSLRRNHVHRLLPLYFPTRPKPRPPRASSVNSTPTSSRTSSVSTTPTTTTSTNASTPTTPSS